MISQILPHFVWYFFSGVAFNEFTHPKCQPSFSLCPCISIVREHPHHYLFALPTSHTQHRTHNTRTYHTLHPLTENPYDFFRAKDYRLFLHFRHHTYTHAENTQHTHTIITLHPLTQNPTTSCLLPSHYLKRQQTSQSVLIFYWSREMATNTQRPSLCCSLLPRITRSMLLRT